MSLFSWNTIIYLWQNVYDVYYVNIYNLALFFSKPWIWLPLLYKPHVLVLTKIPRSKNLKDNFTYTYKVKKSTRNCPVQAKCILVFKIFIFQKKQTIRIAVYLATLFFITIASNELATNEVINNDMRLLEFQENDIIFLGTFFYRYFLHTKSDIE